MPQHWARRRRHGRSTPKGFASSFLERYAVTLRNKRAGNVRMAKRKSKTADTVIPIKRKGSVSSHTNGYSRRASNASGQLGTSRMQKSKILSIVVGVY